MKLGVKISNAFQVSQCSSIWHKIDCRADYAIILYNMTSKRPLKLEIFLLVSLSSSICDWFAFLSNTSLKFSSQDTLQSKCKVIPCERFHPISELAKHPSRISTSLTLDEISVKLQRCFLLSKFHKSITIFPLS